MIDRRTSSAAVPAEAALHGSLAATLSHLALWPALYTLAAAVCMAQLAGVDPVLTAKRGITAAAFALCTATGVYLLDRVKLRDAWMDPADARAHPARFAFIARHSHALRIAIVILLGIAAWCGAQLIQGGAFLPLLAGIGVLAYAGRPRGVRARPKDILLLKNSLVAAGIAGFAAFVALAAAAPNSDPRSLQHAAFSHVAATAFACVHVALRVVADAMLCDLDDEDADRAYGTATMPVQIGRMPAWNVALVLRLLAAACILPIPFIPLDARLAWAAVTVASSFSLRWAKPARLRDWVDARFAAEALAVTLLLLLIRTA